MGSEAFCISAFDTAGGKTADKMFLDKHKQMMTGTVANREDANRYCHSTML